MKPQLLLRGFRTIGVPQAFFGRAPIYVLIVYMLAARLPHSLVVFPMSYVLGRARTWSSSRSHGAVDISLFV